MRRALIILSIVCSVVAGCASPGMGGAGYENVYDGSNSNSSY